MEINARIYAIAESRELLDRTKEILERESNGSYFYNETFSPCEVLTLSRTWYGFSGRAEPTHGPAEWLECLQDCAQVLKKRGAVVVSFWSPDAPDESFPFAYTMASGRAGYGNSSTLPGYRKARGNDDVSLVLREIKSGRSEQERARASGRMRKKEALRREKGDFEITEEGVLTKYRGRAEEVVIPGNVKEIGKAAFVDLNGVERMLVENKDYDAQPMKILTIPEGVEKIGTYAFAYCLNLKEVKISDSVRSIADRAFEGCESLKKINLPTGLERIEEFTFFSCDNLRTVIIPAGVKEIAESAFMDCSQLHKVSLPEGLIRIADEAFGGCYNLERISIPKSVTRIGKDAFPEDTEIR